MDDTLERQVRINARPETVFSYFIDPQKMVRWKGIAAELDPRPGGLYRVDINGNDVAQGRYIEIQPPHRIVFSWGWEGEGHPIPPGSSTVEVTLRPDGEATILTLRHSGLPVAARADHGMGWDHFIERLVVEAAGGDAGPDPWAVGPMPAGEPAAGTA